MNPPVAPDVLDRPLAVLPEPGAPSSTAVDAAGVRRSFGRHAVLDGVSLHLQEGEFVALLGKSGSGKSTLLRILAGLDAGSEGRVEVSERRAVVFQEHRLMPWKKVWRNVALGLTGKGVEAQARQVLDEVGLTAHANAWPATLSGGEAQRVALARAFVRQPSLLLLDEPFGALDALTRIKMHKLLAALCHAHRPAVLLVTHDVDEAILLADRVAVLRDGQLSLDLPIDLPGRRRRTDPAFGALRVRLLAELGVDDDLD
jgi:sulfonate transport system ATP-binding protein